MVTEQLQGASVATKANVFFDGKCVSHTVTLANGEKKSVGVVLAPAQNLLWSGAAGRAFKVDEAGTRRAIACRPLPACGAVVLTSRSHRNPEAMEAWLAQFPGATLDFAGSSLKFCKVAEGVADLYPRFGPTCEWDTAAASAVLLAAGGSVETFDGHALAYAKPKFLNPDFIARGPR